MAYYKSPRLGLETPEPSNSPTFCPDMQKLADQLDELIYPTGDLRFTALPTPTTGWLACEGQAVSRTTYAALYGKIGTAYGEGDKSTTFNLPDYRGRVPMGAGQGTGGEESETFSTRKLGEKIGALLHKLTGAQSGMPEHSHGVTDGGHTHTVEDPGHSHYISPYNDGSGGNPAFSWTVGQNNSPHTPSGTGSETTGVKNKSAMTGVTVNEAGAKAAAESHNIVQPSTVCNVWIKT